MPAQRVIRFLRTRCMLSIISPSPDTRRTRVVPSATAPKVLVIAHRANRTGAEPALENSLACTRACIANGWSVETDIRRDAAGRFYISHDPAPWTAENDAAAFCAAWRDASATIALNIKEIGDEAPLVSYLVAQGVIDRVFLFDMELLEPSAGETARAFRALHPTVQLGARVSDRGERISRALSIECADVIWLDEFDGPWATAHDVAALVRAGRTVYAVSPELHGRTGGVVRARWAQLIAWGVNGICTDYPEALEAFLADRDQSCATESLT